MHNAGLPPLPAMPKHHASSSNAASNDPSSETHSFPPYHVMVISLVFKYLRLGGHLGH
jgi:hypothetical protein